ncbi:MAG: 30S ribosomal protein S3 [Candidatus Moranbacteria bacterium CG06_land_8_20_14_3_00_40_12]|nr:MAG: 30S ribosomal protein S3 [Candidatus Moranbacteria bacterium CG23_combo_of_CG06-09_8_20_14_all_40_16]PIU80706.1 MAG: 30S ribosomal protein S3 [Candidatus Moranbacteria bacterium CG06_land_8_20_14_3_00_40_12]
MGHKINPQGFRIGITNTWRSKWFNKKEYSQLLKQDIIMREGIMRKWKSSAIADVEIIRSAETVKLIIKTARPGVLIGRGGNGIEEIKKYIEKNYFKNRKIGLNIEVKEIKNFSEEAFLVAQNIAEQLEKRMPFRRAIKTMLEQVLKNGMIKGMKIQVSGRLGGAEMSRVEAVAKGVLPLHTLRANINFARATAYTTYGTIGVKVWLYKGDVFKKAGNPKLITGKTI